METAIRGYLAERHEELREARVWVRAWLADPFTFAMFFMAAATEREQVADTDIPDTVTRAE